jgi:nucleotide-binding universal stress UspA family protein
MFKRILVPTDGSAGSRKAARAAFDLATTMGASVVAVRVVPLPVQELAFTGFGVMGAAVPLGIGAAEASAPERDEALLGLRRAARRDGVHFHAARVVDALPVDAIANAAERMHCDLIVMCSRGFGRLIPALTGDVSGGVFRRCSVPMLLVHDDEDKPKENNDKERSMPCTRE